MGSPPGPKYRMFQTKRPYCRSHNVGRRILARCRRKISQTDHTRPKKCVIAHFVGSGDCSLRQLLKSVAADSLDCCCWPRSTYENQRMRGCCDPRPGESIGCSRQKRQGASVPLHPLPNPLPPCLHLPTSPFKRVAILDQARLAESPQKRYTPTKPLPETLLLTSLSQKRCPPSLPPATLSLPPSHEPSPSAARVCFLLLCAFSPACMLSPASHEKSEVIHRRSSNRFPRWPHTRGSGTYGRVCVRVRLREGATSKVSRLGCAATFAKRPISRSRRRRAEAAHLDIQ